MTWNYRVVRKPTGFEGHPYMFGIHEAYYDKDGKLNTWTVNAVQVWAETQEELRDVLIKMTAALEKPVIDDMK